MDMSLAIKCFKQQDNDPSQFHCVLCRKNATNEHVESDSHAEWIQWIIRTIRIEEDKHKYPINVRVPGWGIICVEGQGSPPVFSDAEYSRGYLIEIEALRKPLQEGTFQPKTWKRPQRVWSAAEPSTATTCAGAGQNFVQIKEGAIGAQQQEHCGLEAKQQEQHGPEQADRGPEQQQQKEEKCVVGGKMRNTTKEAASQTAVEDTTTTSPWCGTATSAGSRISEDPGSGLVQQQEISDNPSTGPRKYGPTGHEHTENPNALHVAPGHEHTEYFYIGGPTSGTSSSGARSSISRGTLPQVAEARRADRMGSMAVGGDGAPFWAETTLLPLRTRRQIDGLREEDRNRLTQDARSHIFKAMMHLADLECKTSKYCVMNWAAAPSRLAALFPGREPLRPTINFPAESPEHSDYFWARMDCEMCFRSIVSLPARRYGDPWVLQQGLLPVRVLWCPACGYALAVQGVMSPQGGVDEVQLHRLVSPVTESVYQRLQPVGSLRRPGDPCVRSRLMGYGILLPESLTGVDWAVPSPPSSSSSDSPTPSDVTVLFTE